MSDEISEHDKYVSKINWLVRNGREDLIDEIADQFERSEPNVGGVGTRSSRLAVPAQRLNRHRAVQTGWRRLIAVPGMLGGDGRLLRRLAAGVAAGDLDAVTAASLGAIERQVGRVQQFADLGAVLR